MVSLCSGHTEPRGGRAAQTDRSLSRGRRRVTRRATAHALFRNVQTEVRPAVTWRCMGWGGGLASDRLRGDVWSDEGIVRLGHRDGIAL